MKLPPNTTQFDIAEQYVRFKQYKLEVFEKALRTNAMPPILGVITSDMLKSRDIARITDNATRSEWLEQSGRQITPKVSFNDWVNKHS